MDNEEFQALLLRHRQGKCTLEESLAIQLWYENLNKNLDVIVSDEEQKMLRSRIMATISENIDAPQKEVRPLVAHKRWWIARPWYSVAAAALILIGTYLFFFTDKNVGTDRFGALYIATGQGKLIIKENETGKDQAVTLEDGSIVTLNAGSKIIYASRFPDNKREVQLVGDAFFEITKNPRKPFIVYHGKLATRVLGTSFRMKTMGKGEFFQVEVVTGKVSVFENKAAFKDSDVTQLKAEIHDGIVLTPNHRVTYFPESRHLTAGLVNNPVSLNTEFQNSLKFNNKPLLEIVGQLQKEYGIEIVFGNDLLENCTFTGDISAIPLYDKLNVLSKSTQSRYEVKGTRIVINGAGCN